MELSGDVGRSFSLTCQFPLDVRATEEEFAALDNLILQFDGAPGPGTRFTDSWFKVRPVTMPPQLIVSPQTPTPAAPKL